jgi:hypothetical protein
VTLPEPVDEVPATTAFAPPPPPADGVQLVVKGDGVRPGEEVEMCRYINVGNVDMTWVSKVEVVAAPGLHHSIVSRIAEEREDSESPCFGFPNDLGSQIPLPIFATSTQVTSESIELPDGVGIEMGPRQQLIVNYHYLNYTDERIRPEIYINLHYGKDEEIGSRAGFYSFTNFDDIAIPPGGTQRITMTCPFEDTALLYSTTPHMHRMGRYFALRRWDGEAPAETLYEQEGWFDPVTRIFDPPVRIGKGEGLTFTCEWQSDRDETTYFGESSEHEMCFVFGFFYPSTMDLVGMDGYGCTVVENVVTEAPQD